MPWWNTKNEAEVPEELRNSKPEELITAINKAKEVDGLRTELDAAKAAATAAEGRLAEIERKLAPPPPPPETKRTSFLEDEDVAFNERMAPFAVATLQNQAQTAKFIARNSLRGLDLKIWDKYEDEIATVMQSVQLNFQAQPQTWINALTTVKGRHFDELRKMESEKADVFAEAGDGGGHGGPPRGQSEELTAQEMKLAAAFGVKPEDWQKNKKEMVSRG